MYYLYNFVIIQGEEDRRISSSLINRYISGMNFVEEVEEGQLDLLQVCNSLKCPSIELDSLK